jgi:hypothetical protein
MNELNFTEESMKKTAQFLALVFCLGSSTAYADSSDQMMTMLESLKQQMSRMQETIDRQNVRIQQLESHRVLETPQANVPVSPSSGATMSDADFQKSLKDNVGEAIPWLKGAKYGGDFRLRYESFNFYDKNNDAGSTGTANDRTRNRFRIRLRWGFEKDFGDDWKAGFRLATGTTTEPTSTNQTLGNPGYFNFKTINVERAYAVYDPNGLKDYGALKGVKVGAGKFENPFLRYSTTIVWDADVTPEGIYEQANFSLVSTEENKLNLQTTAGQFIVNENAAVESDAAIYGYQGAVNYSTYNFGTDKPVDINLAASYYDYTNRFQTNLAANNTAATSYLRTNSIVADDFRVLDLYPEISFSVASTPVTLWYDFAKNLANVGTDDFRQSGGNDIHDTDTAWGAGFRIGKAKVKGSWEAFYGYYEIGANSVVAAFNDSDFGGPGTQGFTNRKGHKFGLGYQLTDNIVINWTGYLVRPLNPFNSTNANFGLQFAQNEDVFRSQLDVVYKF